MSATTLPLDGIAVVATEQAIAARLCARRLAELGAGYSRLSIVNEATSPGIMATVPMDCAPIYLDQSLQIEDHS